MLELKRNLFDVEENWKTYTYEILENGEKIGTASIIADESEGDDELAYIESLDIDETFRNKGFGTEFIKTIAKKYWKTYIAPTNEDNQRLYARLGEETNDLDVDQGYGVYKIN